MTAAEAEHLRAVVMSLLDTGDITQAGALKLDRAIAQGSW